MGILSVLRPKKDDTAFQFSAAAAQSDLQNPQNNPEEQLETLTKISHLLTSSIMEKFFLEHPHMQALIPAFDRVNRTTKITQHEAEIMWLDFKILFIKMKLTMPTEIFEQGATAFFSSLEILANSIITDARDGWKGHLLTEQVRRLDVALNKKSVRY